MATVRLHAADGAEKGSIELNDAIFDVEMNPTMVHDVVVAQQAAGRQGTAKTKTRKEVAGGGQKPFRQKGTGRARQGSSREPQMRGGGTVFGPQPRSYRKKVPVAFKRRALCCALSSRVRDEALCVMEAIQAEAPKTKPMHALLQMFSKDTRGTLLVLESHDANVTLSTRNIPKVRVCTAADLNVVDVLNSRRVVLAQGALAKLEERLL